MRSKHKFSLEASEILYESYVMWLNFLWEKYFNRKSISLHKLVQEEKHDKSMSVEKFVQDNEIDRTYLSCKNHNQSQLQAWTWYVHSLYSCNSPQIPNLVVISLQFDVTKFQPAKSVFAQKTVTVFINLWACSVIASVLIWNIDRLNGLI